MPIGKTIGRASIRIIPDASGFRRATRARVDAETNGLDRKVNIRIDGDASPFLRKMRMILARRYTIDVAVDANTRRVDMQIDRLRQRLRREMTTTIRASMDLEQASLREAQAQAQAWFMANPIRARVEVEMSMESLRAAHARAQAAFGDLNMSVNTDVDWRSHAAAISSMEAATRAGRPIGVPVRADLDTASVAAAMARLRAAISGNNNMLNTFAGRIQLIGMAAFAALPTLLSMVNAVKLMSGALAAGPAAILGLVSTMLVFKMAFSGIMKEIKDSQKKNGAPLTGPTKELAASIQMLQGKYKALQQTIRGEVLPGFAAIAKAVAGRPFDVWSSGMAAFARSLSSAMTSLGQVLTQTTFLRNFNTAMQTMAAGVKPLGSSLGSIVRIFMAFAAGAAPVVVQWLTSLAGWFSRTAASSERLAKNGTIKRWAQEGGAAFGQFVNATADVISAINNIAKAAPSGGSFLNGFSNFAAQFKAFSADPSVQAGLTATFTAINAGLARMGQLIQAWAPVAGRLFAAMIVGATPMVELLTNIGVAAGNVLEKLTGFDSFVSVLGTLLMPVMGMVLAYRAWTTATAALSAAQVLLSVGVRAVSLAMAANPIGLTIAAIAALVATLIYAYQHWTWFREAAQAAWGFLASTFGPGLTALWTGIKAGIAALWAYTLAVWPAMWNTAVSVFNIAKQTIISVAQGVWSFLVSAFNGIRSTVTTSVLIVQTIITTSWKVIQTVYRTAIAAIRTSVSAGFNAVKTLITTTSQVIVAFLTGNWRAIPSIIRGGVNQAKSQVSSGFSAMKSLVSTAISNMVSTVTQGFGRLGGIARSGISNAISAARGMVGSAVSVGAAIVAGIARGITSGIGGVVRAAVNAVKSAVSAAKSAMSINSPSKVTALTLGAPMSEGVAMGIYNKAAAVRAALVKTVNAAAKKLAASKKVEVPFQATVNTKQKRADTTQKVLDDQTAKYKRAQNAQAAAYLKYQQARSKYSSIAKPGKDASDATKKAYDKARAAADKQADIEYKRYLAAKKRTLEEKRLLDLRRQQDTAADRELKKAKANLKVKQDQTKKSQKALDDAKKAEAKQADAVKKAAQDVYEAHQRAQSVPVMPDVFDPGLVQMTFGPTGMGTMNGSALGPQVMVTGNTFGADPDEVAVAINRNQRRSVSMMNLRMAGVSW